MFQVVTTSTGGCMVRHSTVTTKRRSLSEKQENDDDDRQVEPRQEEPSFKRKLKKKHKHKHKKKKHRHDEDYKPHSDEPFRKTERDNQSLEPFRKTERVRHSSEQLSKNERTNHLMHSMSVNDGEQQNFRFKEVLDRDDGGYQHVDRNGSDFKSRQLATENSIQVTTLRIKDCTSQVFLTTKTECDLEQQINDLKSNDNSNPRTDDNRPLPFILNRWEWAPNSYIKKNKKGRQIRTHYRELRSDTESIRVGDCVSFVADSPTSKPYIGRVKGLFELSNSKS